MYVIRKLRLYGFKSFPKETVIEFSPGLTGIVGPNGCGKSNIADAILWVMGEQSVKNLRGGVMEDVVFNGSDKLAPMGMAEVELRIENLEPKEGEERFLTIERKYFREGDGQYRLNGKRVRRKDIQERLFELGLGSKSYAIIEQGRVSTLINARPEDRRFMIEDAAGILKYKMKKKEAESKMRLTSENLERVEDIIAEVKRNLNSLRQQAARARQYRTLQDDLREQKGAWLAHRAWEWDEKIRAREKERGELQDRFAKVAAERADVEARMEEQKRHILDLENEVSLLNRDYFDRKLKSERLESEIGHSESKLKELVDRLGSYEERFKQMESELAEIRKNWESEQHNLDLVKEDIGNLEIRKEDMESRLDGFKQQLAEREKAYEAADLGLKDVEGRANTLSSELSFLKKSIRELNDDVAGKHGIRETMQKELAELKQQVETRKSTLGDLEKQLSSNEQARLDAETEQSARKGRLAELQEQLKKKDIEIASLENHMASMQRFLENREGFSENVRKLMDTRPDLVSGVLGDFIETDGKADAAVEACFAPFYQVIVPASEGAFQELVALAQQEKLGGVAILVPGLGKGKTGSAGLAAHLNWKEPVSGELARYLAGIQVVDTVEAGRSSGSSFVTPSGDYFLAETGVLTVGGAGDHGFFTIKTGIRESEAGLAEAAISRESLLKEMTEAESRVSQQRELLQDIRNQADRLKVDLSSTKASIESEQNMLVSKQADIDRVGAEVDTKTGRITELEQRLAEAEKELGTLDEKTQDLIREKRDKQRLVDEVREELEYMVEEFNDLKILHEKRISTVTSLEKELQFLERRAAEIQSNLEQTKRNQEVDGENRAVLHTHIERTREKADAVVDEYRSIDAVLTEKKQTLEAQRRELMVLENTVNGFRKQENQIREGEQEIQLKLVESRTEQSHVFAQMDELLDGAPRPDIAAATDPDTLKEKVDRLDKRMHNFGAVNLLAIEECAEHEERHEFLTVQREDLVKSMNNLTRDIREIDKTTKVLFEQAFTAIRDTFAEVFTRLFGGGTANLTLTDPDDPLETGVEIFAQPPGKKIQSITLMSGGEKALTALALLFAIFEYRISPLCVLDEVDAPLDEANVIQLGQFLRRYRDRVQFVVVTHNKTTMEMVDFLYGVTMEEPGCSKMVSVRLDERTPS